MFKSNSKVVMLQEVSPKELMQYRLSGEAGLVIKLKDKLLLAKFPRKSKLLTRKLCPSLCATCDCICKCCPKVTDLTLSIQLGVGRSFPDAVQRYGRIEKYDFITSAVEMFNKNSSNCVILECANYSKRNPDDYEPQYFAETI